MSSYLVIARKWRPNVFDEIIGQDHVTKTLKNAISTGRVAQAYLFSGPRGVGKTTAARILAKCLNCTADAALAPCNECASCRAITNGSSVDVLEIDGASNTGVENVRELRENIMYMPAGGRRKIYIIDEVHMLSISAFNALLKTLEEPPSHVVFIFATTEVRKIPLTILSRCQRFEFRRIPVIKMEAHLKKILLTEKIAFEEDALFAIAREADGSLRDAESLLDQVLAFGGESVRLIDVTEALGLMDRSVLLELMRAITDKNGGLSLNIIEKIYDFGYDLRKACGELLAITRDMTAIKVTGGTAVIEAPAHELTALKEMAEARTVEDLHMLFLLLQKGYEGIARSAFARHAFEMTVLRASSFDSLGPIDELLKKLESLGPGPGGGGRAGNLEKDSGVSQKGAVRDRSAAARASRGLPWQKTAPALKKGAHNSTKGPDNFKKGPDKRATGPDNLTEGPDRLTAGPDNFTKGADNSYGGPDSFKKGPAKEPDNLRAGPDDSGNRPDNLDKGPVDSGKGPIHGPQGQGSPSLAMEAGAPYSSGGLSEAGAEKGRGGDAVPDRCETGLQHAGGVEGLIGYIKKHDNGALYGSLKSSTIDLKDKRVEIKTTPQAFTFLKMKTPRMEKLFSEYLKGPVKVALTAQGADLAQEKDPAADVLRILGGKVLEDGYGDGG